MTPRATGISNVTVLPTAAARPPPNPSSRRGRYPKGVVHIHHGFNLLYLRRQREKDAAASEHALRVELQMAIDRQKAEIRSVAELSAQLAARARKKSGRGDFA